MAKEDGGFDLRSNTQGLCNDCHVEKTKAERQARAVAAAAQRSKSRSHANERCKRCGHVEAHPGEG